MNQQREQLQQQTRTSQQAITTSFDAEAQADGLLERANAEQAEQATLLDTPSIESQYATAPRRPGREQARPSGAHRGSA